MIYAGLSDDEKIRLLACYEAGFAAGSGRPWLIDDDDPALIELVMAVANTWYVGLEVRQAAVWLEAPLLAPEQIPEWLRAEQEREGALGDAPAPEGWRP